MRASHSALLAATLLLTACSGFSTSKLNPFNWFGRAEPQTMEFVERPEDPRALIAEVTELTVEPYPGGAIIRASGLPPTQGWWEAELVKAESEEEGVLVYDFRIYPPTSPRPAGTPTSREVTVATAISDFTLAEVTRIVVQGAGNALSSRR